jgi:hypothetical protein
MRWMLRAGPAAVWTCGQLLAAPSLATAAPPPNSNLSVTPWASFDNPSPEPGPHHSLIVKPVDPQAEDIIVYANRRARLDAQWRAEIAGEIPSYEAAQSDAAQRLYAPDPTWGSPEEQRWTSSLKDYVGACGLGAAGVQISCPNLP